MFLWIPHFPFGYYLKLSHLGFIFVLEGLFSLNYSFCSGSWIESQVFCCCSDSLSMVVVVYYFNSFPLITSLEVADQANTSWPSVQCDGQRQVLCVVNSGRYHVLTAHDEQWRERQFAMGTTIWDENNDLRRTCNRNQTCELEKTKIILLAI